MKNVTDTITTKSGIALRVEKRIDERQIEIAVQMEAASKCLLHWGVQRSRQGAWEIPPQSVWPPSTNAVAKNAVQTPFTKGNGGEQILIQLKEPADYSSISFVLFFPDRKRWDNNDGKNYQIEFPKSPQSHGALEKVFDETIAAENILFKRVFDVNSEGQLAAAVVKKQNQFVVTLMTDVADQLILHWGIARYSSYDWSFPPTSFQPSGTTVWQSTAQTPLTIRADNLSELRLAFPEKDAPMGIPFVLKRADENRWLMNDGENFFIPVATAAPKDTSLELSSLAKMTKKIIAAETGTGSWTLMHRFNLCRDFLEQVSKNVAGLATLFVWMRFSAIRQLTWQRNYNTKPRELSHAQDRLTAKLAETFSREPVSRPLTRLMLTTVGRGGEGQRIRDEILNIMHRHHIKEVSGHFTEEWHQKLHNNTTPDDIVICQAYLEFLRSNGNLNLFYETLQKNGVTKGRLESFERPITTAPDFVPHLKDALIHDFENFLRILKSVHESTDFETARNEASSYLDDNLRNLLNRLSQNRNNDGISPVHVIEMATEARREIQYRLNSGNGIRELLYLDLALEQLIRIVVERNIHLRLSGDQLTDLVSSILENLSFNGYDEEFSLCLRHWNRLKAQMRFGQDWSMHAKSVLDRASRVLSRVIDRTYQLLQPKAEFLGNAFHANAWTITLFSEEVVRGSSLGFALSMLIHHLDPILRQGAQLGNWQVISRGSATGVVQLIADLHSIQGKRFDAPRVIVTEKVRGDEEIPEDVVAVIAPNVTDIVSHVAVRARNANLLFAACLDSKTLDHLKGFAGCHVNLSINAPGDVVFKEVSGQPKTIAPRARLTRKLAAKPEFKNYAIAAKDFNPQTVGQKSCNQTRLYGKLADWIQHPVSIAVPFGVFEHVLSLGTNKDVAELYKQLVSEIYDEPQTKLHELRDAILKLAVPIGLVRRLHDVASAANLPWPAKWEDSWNCIKHVWASKWNERAYFSRETAGIAHDELFMAVLIQQVVEADYAFVIHTTNPITGNRDELYSEIVPGLGETIVANYPGRAFGFTFNRKTGAKNILCYPGKSVGLYGGALIFRSDSNGEDLAGYAGAGLYDSVLLPRPREALLDYSNVPLIFDEHFKIELLDKIAQLGMEIERLNNSPQDIEGAVAKGKFYVLQTRPQVGVGNV